MHRRSLLIALAACGSANHRPSPVVQQPPAQLPAEQVPPQEVPSAQVQAPPAEMRAPLARVPPPRMPPAAPAAPAAPEQAQTPPACLPRAFRDGRIAELAQQDGQVRLCYEIGSDVARHACLRLDRDSKVIGEATWKQPAWPVARPAFTLEVTGPGYRVCERDTKSCSSFRVGHPRQERLEHAGVVSDDGALAFVLYDRPNPPAARSTFRNEITGELYETRSGRLLGSVKLTSTLPMGSFGDPGQTRAVEILGRQVVVGAYPAGPSGTAALVDPATGKGIRLHGYRGDHLLLDARSLLVLDEQALSVVDMPTLATAQTHSLPGREFTGNDAHVSSRMLQLGGSILVAYAQPAGTAVYDVATRALATPRPLPICAK